MALPRTTIYYWVRDLPIAPSHSGGGFTTVAQRKGSQAMQARYRHLRENAYELGRWEYPRLLRFPTFRDFVCMYIGEGFKRSRNEVAIANSDPAVMKLGKPWIEAFTRNRIRYTVQYHEDQDLEELRSFWASELGLLPADIRVQRKSNSNRLSGRNWRSRWGVLTVAVGDTQLRSRLQGWIDRTKEQWLDSPEIGA